MSALLMGYLILAFGAAITVPSAVMYIKTSKDYWFIPGGTGVGVLGVGVLMVAAAIFIQV